MLADSEDQRIDRSTRIALLDNALIQVRSMPDEDKRNIFFFKIANRYWNLNDVEKYKSVVLEVSKCPRLSNKTKLKVHIYLGDYYDHWTKLKLDSALYHYDTAEKFTIKGSNQYYELQFKKTSALFHAGQYFECSQIVKDILSSTRDAKGLKNYDSDALSYLAAVALMQKDYDEAFALYKKSLSAEDDLCKIASAYNNLANVALELGKYNTSEAYLNKAKYYSEITDCDLLIKASISENEARLSASKSLDIEAVKNSYKRAIRNCDSLIYDRAIVRFSFANYLESIGDVEESYQNLLESLRLSSDIDEKAMILHKIILHPLTNDNRYLDEYFQTNTALKELASSNQEILVAQKYFHSRVAEDRRQQIFTLYEYSLILFIVGLLLVTTLVFKNIKMLSKNISLINVVRNKDRIIADQVVREYEEKKRSVAQERFRVSQELHDGIVNDIIALRFELYSKLISEFDVERLKESIGKLQVVEKQIRNISHGLSDIKLENGDFEDTIQDMFVNFCRNVGFDWEVNIDVLSCNLISYDESLNFFRIIQELLNNTYKHADATKVQLNFYIENENLIFNYNDNGYCSAKVKKGVGLLSIERRVEHMMGQMFCDFSNKGMSCVIIKKVGDVQNTNS